MKRCSTVWIVLAFLASLCLVPTVTASQTTANAQAVVNASTSPEANVAPPVSTEPSPFLKGTNLVAEFSHGVNAKKIKAGDKVKAVLTQDLVIKGRIVAPVESKLVGHVTLVKLSTDADPESELGVVFDKILLKHHKELALQAGVQALLPPVIRHSRIDEPDQMMPPPVVASQGGLSGGTRGAGASGSRSSNTSSTTSSVASLNSIGAVPTVQSTPGSNPGSAVSSIDLARVNTAKLSASNGMRGVYGIKGLALGPPSASGALIVSSKSNVKLENGTQIILVVLR